MIRIIESTQNKKYYIRFGDIPKHERSTEYDDGEAIDKELGVSVWDCALANGIYHPILPQNPNEDAIADFYKLLWSDRPVYLLTGTELNNKGTDGEPLLKGTEIVEEYGDGFYKELYTHQNNGG